VDSGLLNAARAGDREAIGDLMAPHLARLRALAYRILANRDDAEDAVQEALARALDKIAGFRGEAGFATWLYRITVNVCRDVLRRRQRWRWDAQVHASHACSASAHHQRELFSTLEDPEFRFDAAEHIAFCFSCVGRSLEPGPQMAVLLREVFELSNREAAEVLEINESVLRHDLAAGRKAMQKAFDGLCALIGKDGICHQCAGLRNRTPAARRGPEPVIEAAGEVEAAFQQRARISAGADLENGVSRNLHDLLFRKIGRWETDYRLSGVNANKGS
jgi:RNA polymerase sigma-70 factor (ECF subfamily)